MIEEIRNLLQEVKAERLSQHQLLEKSSQIALLLLQLSSSIITPEEREKGKLLNRIIHDESLKAFTASVVDSCLRTKDPKKAMGLLKYFAKRYAVTSSLFWYEKIVYAGGICFISLFPKKAFSLMKKILQEITGAVIIPADYNAMYAHLATRAEQGITSNINRLGEAILGEKEAARRIDQVLCDLQHPIVEVVSVKISSIYSQITPIAYKHALHAIKEKLSTLFAACKKFRTLRKQPKFLYLDMEEYKDLHLTVQAFQEVLSQPEFFSLSAGIALQSYIPDSLQAQKTLTEWAHKRVMQGGGVIKIRLVKGANLGMEKQEASLKNWPQAPFKTKAEVDANFKKMLHYGLKHTEAVHIAIASHNIFDIAYALLLRSMYHLEHAISFEMLEGMCSHVTFSVFAVANSMLLYCPTVRQQDIHTAMAYLIRRLDENTQKEHFLAHLFDIEGDPLGFIDQRCRFERSVMEQERFEPVSRRFQDRSHTNNWKVVSPSFHSFTNEPDTDWSLSQNRIYGETIVTCWKERTFDIPCIFGTGIVFTKKYGRGVDPSRPGFPLLTYALASEQEVDQAIRYAVNSNVPWVFLPVAEKAKTFRRLAGLLCQERAELTYALVAESGKTFQEADSEVSEAIDFANFYASVMEEEQDFFHLTTKRKKIAFVASPWNFSCSLALNNLIAPLAAGYSVLFKPALEGCLVGFKLTELLYQAGIPKESVQFLPCVDDPVGSYIVKHPAVGPIIMTGSTETARLFMKMKPVSPLFGETGGKNCAIVTALADRDVAVKEIIQSAFGYAGQKCSALSLCICEEEVYRDPGFMEQLVDAASSLACGSSWDFATRVNPLIRPPSGKLLRAITTLEPMEKWLLQPKISRENPSLVSPGIKCNVQPNSFTQKTELFGPILGVMCAKNLREAISLANMPQYGLTSGIFSLDPRESAQWLSSIDAGNCYINRNITGAIVRRQPFGGVKASSFGVGMKTGGCNYLLQMVDSFAGDLIDDPEIIRTVERRFQSYLRQLQHPEEKGYFIHAVSSYVFWKETYFSHAQELDRVVGEDNFLTYRPHDHIFFYVNRDDILVDCLLVLAAAEVSGCAITIGGCKDKISNVSPQRFNHLISRTQFPRFRAISQPPLDVVNAWGEIASCIDISKPQLHGRLELLRYHYEVTITSSYHRYGSLFQREHEQRNSIL